MKRIVSLLLVVVMTVAVLTTPVSAANASSQDIQTGYVDISGNYVLEALIVDGVEFVRLRDIADLAGATVTWDRANQAVRVATAYSATTVIVVADTGGFLRDGRVWIPAVFALEVYNILAYAPSTVDDGVAYEDDAEDDADYDDNGNIEDDNDNIEIEDPLTEDQQPDEWAPASRDDIDYSAPVVRTTDHGEMAVEFMVEMNDNLYNRVAFTYRELEAAQWIVDQLLGMGFNESYVDMQTFSFEDGLEVVGEPFAASFAVFGELNLYDPDTRLSLEEAVDVFLAREMELAEEMAIEQDIPLEDLLAAYAEQFDVPADELEEFLATMIYLQLSYIDNYFGIFDQEIEFRPYSQNVLLTIPGQSERKIVITAHYDTILVPGASDNASGVALLLESAYRMRDVDNYFTIVYAFVGAEEVGLVGAFYYLENLTPAARNNLVLNINADVLIEGPYFFYGTAASDGANWVFNPTTEWIEAIAQDLNENYGTALISAPDLAAMPSDQLAFLFSGHTVLALTGLARAGAPAYAAFPGLPMYAQFTASVVHTQFDDVHFISATWPEKIGDAMWTFGLFLDRILRSIPE